MKVELMYFKPESGKFYTSGEYDSAYKEAWEIFAEVRAMAKAKALPDLYPALIKAQHGEIG